LIEWHPATGEYRRINRKDGLPNDMVYAVYGDQKGSLWMSTDYGIVRYEPESGSIQTFLPEDGTSNQEYNRLSHFQNERGQLFFGGIQRGLTRVAPEKNLIEERADVPNLVVTFFHQLDRKADTIVDRTAELLTSKTIELKADNQGFRMGVALLVFDNQEKVQYAWKVGEESEDWNYQFDPVIQLSQLQYGEHQLTVRAQAPGGEWSPDELSVSLIVPSPFFFRIWFWCLMALVLLVAIYAGYRYRVFLYRLQQLRLQEKIEEATQQILLDKSTIEKQAQQLKRLDELKSTFFANLSHEFRTPLTLILGPVRSMIGRDYLREQDRMLLTTIEENGNKLLKMVNELLDLTRIEAKKLDVEEKPVLLYPFLLKLFSDFEVHAGSAGVAMKLDYQLDKDLCLLMDREKLDRILSNFLTNAIKFTPRGGYVSFRVLEKSGVFRFEVIDSGLGIHEEDQPFVFNRYFRSKHLRKSKVEGTGIGLALCKELTELLNGEIGMESIPDEGSVFWCTFPFKPPDKSVPASQEEFVSSVGVETDSGASSTTDQDHQGRANQYAANLLIAEDHPSLREFLSFLLKRKYNLTLVSNGQEALEKLRPQLKSPDLIAEEERIHLVITDIRMPQLDGLSLLEKIKSAPNGKLLPVIIMTARADMKDKLRALHIGVDDYLLKPFVEEELLARITNLLDQARLRRVPAEQAAGGGQAALESHLGEVDLEFLKKLELLVEKEIKDSSLSTSWLAGQFSLSERQLQRKLKQITGLSPNHYVRAIRLQKARELLERGRFGTVAEISYAVGFSTPSYFSRIYKRQFGKSPSDYF
jgi:signal transduction histidine kinase/DNA-binding response OmpR family regulator